MGRSDRRGTRTGRKSRPKQAKAGQAKSDAQVYQHPQFGPIPLIVRSWIDGDGQARAGYEMDPDYQPPLPPGAVRGDPRRQLGRGAFDTPRYFYVDQPRICVQCRESFVFAAAEQKHWYETLGFNFASVAVRCRACRRKRRSDKALHHAVDDAKRAIAADPNDAAAQLALAEAIVELHLRRVGLGPGRAPGSGKLDEAVAAARKARRLLADRPANVWALTHYWEGRAQAQAGRIAKARAALQLFLQHAGAKAHRQQIRTAERWLETAT